VALVETVVVVEEVAVETAVAEEVSVGTVVAEEVSVETVVVEEASVGTVVAGEILVGTVVAGEVLVGTVVAEKALVGTVVVEEEAAGIAAGAGCHFQYQSLVVLILQEFLGLETRTALWQTFELLEGWLEIDCMHKSAAQGSGKKIVEGIIVALLDLVDLKIVLDEMLQMIEQGKVLFVETIVDEELAVVVEG